MIEEINNIYNDIQDLETVLTEYNIAKTDLKNCESEIKNLEMEVNSKTKVELEECIAKLENEHKNILNEIKKIDLCTKECYKISEIKAMFEFVNDQDILITKCTNFLNSLIYDLFISKEEFVKYFSPEKYKEVELKNGWYKILKISHDLSELFSILKEENKSDILSKCYFNLKMILEEELGNVLPEEIFIYYDSAHFYLIFWSDQSIELNEAQYFTSMSYANTDYLYSQKNITTIFYEIFKNNLTERLLANEISDKDILETNDFLKNTEYYITNINEWKLDCVMKEVIVISKSQKANELKSTTDEKITSFISKVDKKFLPDFISLELYRFLLCMNVFNTIESKRLEKAIKIMERALYKMMNQEDPFIAFADISLCLRVFSNLSINAQLSNLREHFYSEITRKSTDLTKNLQDSLILLKVYFKGKHFDFIESVKKFVPKNSQMAFEITFFNLIYTNVLDNIFCMKFLSNDKIADLSEVLRYLLDMSFNIPKECISVYSKFNSVCFIFSNDLEGTIAQYKNGKIDIPSNELTNFITLLYKDSKTRNNFLSSIV